MRMDREKMNDDIHLTTDVRTFQRVDEFEYLRTIITDNNNTSKEICARIHRGNKVTAAP